MAAAHAQAAVVARRRYVPVKVEPKTFFANERTMLQWLSMSILILFMSLALLSLDGGGYRGTAVIVNRRGVLLARHPRRHPRRHPGIRNETRPSPRVFAAPSSRPSP